MISTASAPAVAIVIGILVVGSALSLLLVLNALLSFADDRRRSGADRDQHSGLSWIRLAIAVMTAAAFALAAQIVLVADKLLRGWAA